jgi:hypothetical protein
MGDGALPPVPVVIAVLLQMPAETLLRFWRLGLSSIVCSGQSTCPHCVHQYSNCRLADAGPRPRAGTARLLQQIRSLREGTRLGRKTVAVWAGSGTICR